MLTVFQKFQKLEFGFVELLNLACETVVTSSWPFFMFMSSV